MINVQHSSFTMDYEKVTDCEICFSADVMRDSKVFKANGRAVCSPEDEFNIEFGRQLAYARALQKAFKKLEKELIRYSYKNGRKRNINSFCVSEFYNHMSEPGRTLDENEIKLIVKAGNYLQSKGIQY